MGKCDMEMSEAEIAVQPFLTRENSKIYAKAVDKMLWVECNIFNPAGVSASVNSNFGAVLCVYCEDKLDLIG
jgi:hypothetical protein